MMEFEKMEFYYHKQPVDGATHQLYTKAKGQTTVKKTLFYSVLFLYLFFVSDLYFLLVNLQTLPLKKTFKNIHFII